ncbi:2-aminoethylphosphonate abc atp-binding protein [Leptolyngbya sp. Heron Island J]|uniref:putative 2-aminoethylphosphonate ABC transporter ATP-binding protein n=1 Tax=Leptolyngbya sp. Heron Island J TaxID=1385935 RepID=UPI0003B9DA59|nr:putative 2-aminoethylphosphonate ABC transporter ATP-binding protein [Leptolyngbya sp. Heron Island J]ESA33654.1 2-aminoethylphosphonate abc atp-binding protein [Leptolyngbya sp. Heron Island J]
MHFSEKSKAVSQSNNFDSSADPLTQRHGTVVTTTDRPEPYLRVENVYKQFGSFVALKQIYLDIYPGEFVCFLGPSGCGKTTLLRAICGLDPQTSGRVIQAGQDVSNLPPSKRDFGIVFQSYALFPNLTAAQNIAYGLENAGQPKSQIKARVQELLEKVGLGQIGQKYPAQMSGGQQQRVALARALAMSPGLLLLDEPLSALDAKVRVKLRTEIARIQKELGVTTVMVTHDQEEAMAIADRIVVMDNGYLAQVGTAYEIYQQPNSPFVADFIGVMNFIEGEVIAADQVRCGNAFLQVPRNDIPVGQKAVLAVRPEAVEVLDVADTNGHPNTSTAQVEGIEFLGSNYQLSLRITGTTEKPVLVEITAAEALKFDLSIHSSLNVQLPPETIRVFAADAV